MDQAIKTACIRLRASAKRLEDYAKACARDNPDGRRNEQIAELKMVAAQDRNAADELAKAAAAFVAASE